MHLAVLFRQYSLILSTNAILSLRSVFQARLRANTTELPQIVRR